MSLAKFFLLALFSGWPATAAAVTLARPRSVKGGSLVEKTMTHRLVEKNKTHRLIEKQKTHRKTPYPNLPAVGMVKVHKAASTTLLKIMQRLYRQENMTIWYPESCHYLGWPGKFPGRDDKGTEPARQFDLIGDHSVFNGPKFSAYLKPNAAFVLLARGPSGQAVSAFNFFKMRMNHTKAIETWAQHLDFVEELQNEHKSVKPSIEVARWLNPQSWDLGWYEYAGMTNKFDNHSSKVNEWLDRLDQYFGGAGSQLMVETFDQGLVLLARRLGVHVKELAYVPQNERSQKYYPNEEEKQRIEKLYGVDRKFFARYNKTFFSHWEAAGSSRESELRQLRQHSAVLVKACESRKTCPPEWTMNAVQYTRYLSTHDVKANLF